MKSYRLTVILASIFLLAIIALNPFSLAQDSSEKFVDEKIYQDIKESENGMAKIIVELKGNLEIESEDELKQASREYRKNINKFLDELSSEVGKENFNLIYEYENLNSLAIEVNEESLEAVKNNKDVTKIHSEQILEIQLAESTTLINADDVWAISQPPLIPNGITGRKQTVCVLDTGIDYNHPAFAPGFGSKIGKGYDFVNSDSDPMDDNGHGTHVSGIIAANGMARGVMIKGVAPDAIIMPQKVCNAAGSCTNINMIAGINRCINYANRKMAAVSISIGDGQNYPTAGACPTWLDAGINTLYSLNVPVVVSSGNQGYKNGMSYPACSPNAISVGMTYDNNVGLNSWPGVCIDWSTSTDKVSCASNSGPNLDVMAPGAVIVSTASSIATPTSCSTTGLPPGLMKCSGTSMAAPHVAGSIALFKERIEVAFPSYSAPTLPVSRILRFVKRSPVQVIDLGNGISYPRIDLSVIL